MESAFNVKLFNYAHADGNYRGRVGYLFIPDALNDIVQGIVVQKLSLGVNTTALSVRRPNWWMPHSHATVSC